MIVANRTLLFLTAWCTLLSAESKPLELKWTELAPVIVSHGIELELSDGGKIRGEAIAIREDTMVVDVRKSTGTKAYAKGSATIPRGAITLITLVKTRGSWGAGIGTTVGVVAGLGIGGYSAAHTDSGGAAVAILVAVISGVAVIGYYAGKGLDTRRTRITILP